ncbi:protein FAR-RED IMPAIRED RESPONSE 1-like [Chenopodium quinoa]|uniref:protein FAR-RED IMPAIRED RESPONSE 1-like n=1 Tax=Chenopodium quinoa TaxID=63459 RepID=UPI000B796FC9|nr:protein FAR-RED IMPAIRED RESPONSE 1-like [Chenopodium quinoa]
MEEGIEDIVVAGSCADDMNVRYLSPVKTIHSTHTVVGSNEIVVVVEEPKEGMVFQSWQEVEAYYKDYVEQMGFGVSRAQGVNSKMGDKKKIKVMWKCECWGKPDMRARREAKKRAKAMGLGGLGGLNNGVVCKDELSGTKRTSKKCECEARVYAKVNENGLWELKSVQLEHNHEINPANSKLVKEYRMKQMTSAVKKRLFDFYEWLAFMKNRAPKAILTDQAASMLRPLAEVMPNTVHCWCIWHIMSKIPEKLGKCARYQEFVNPLKELVYESFDPKEFQTRWAEFIAEYKLEDNEWLQILHKESRMWVPAFVKDFFWAGMKTTQRVESINRFFDGYVNRKEKLHEFPQKYCMALDQCVRDEVSADERCSKYLRRLVSGFKVENIPKLYTDNKFQEVQKECTRMMYCNVRGEKVLSENLIQYSVVYLVWIVPPGASEDVITNRRRTYNVTFCPMTQEVQCDCRKFETSGILANTVLGFSMKIWLKIYQRSTL